MKLMTSRHTFHLTFAMIFVCFLCVIWSDSAIGAVTVTGSTTHSFTVVPGETIHGTIELINSDDYDQVVHISLSDYMFDASGKSTLGTSEKHDRSNQSWVTIEGGNTVIVPSNGKQLVRYSISVPNDATMTGTYWSVILVDVPPLTTPDNSDTDENQSLVTIRAHTIFVIQIVTNFAATGRPTLELNHPSLLLKEDGTGYVFQVDVANNGDLWIRPQVWMEVIDQKGALVGRFDSRGLRIYPGTSVRQIVDLPGLDPGSYTALLMFDGGAEHVFAARFTLNIKDED